MEQGGRKFWMMTFAHLQMEAWDSENPCPSCWRTLIFRNALMHECIPLQYISITFSWAFYQQYQAIAWLHDTAVSGSHNTSGDKGVLSRLCTKNSGQDLGINLTRRAQHWAAWQLSTQSQDRAIERQKDMKMDSQGYPVQKVTLSHAFCIVLFSEVHDKGRKK